MNKTELVAAVALKADITQAAAGRAIDGVLSAIAEQLSSGGKVSLVGFGTFEVRERAERQGRNPQTGAVITIPAAKNPSFKPGKTLKDAIN